MLDNTFQIFFYQEKLGKETYYVCCIFPTCSKLQSDLILTQNYFIFHVHFRRFISIQTTSLKPMHRRHLSDDWRSSRFITAAATSLSSPWWQNPMSSHLEHPTKLFRILSQGSLAHTKGMFCNAVEDFPQHHAGS